MVVFRRAWRDRHIAHIFGLYVQIPPVSNGRRRGEIWSVRPALIWTQRQGGSNGNTSEYRHHRWWWWLVDWLVGGCLHKVLPVKMGVLLKDGKEESRGVAGLYGFS